MSAPVAVIAGRSKYLDILDEAWARHLAPRAIDAPTVISTFAGCGGSSLGYSMAGFRELLAVEWDDNAVATFALNFPDVPIYHGDIAECSVEAVLERTGLAVGALDVLDGSPPCQGFSTAGKRILDDPRNQLFREYVRLLRGLQPKVFVMENVSGMVKGKMKLVFAECLRELKAAGYRVSARLMNAMYFHVPQSRQRMIFIGVREDLGVEPSHPVGAERLINASEALMSCTPKTFGEYRANASAQKVKAAIPFVRVGRSYASSVGGNTGFNLVRVHPDRPCSTIPTTVSLTGHYGGTIHPSIDRLLAAEEIQRLSSFPDSFRFVGEFTDRWKRIGNSVPPLFMRAIAQHINAEILSTFAGGTHG